MDLSKVLELFNCAATEEQAWAIIYQASTDIYNCRNASTTGYPLPELKSLCFLENGSISVINSKITTSESEVCKNVVGL